jgi:porin
MKSSARFRISPRHSILLIAPLSLFLIAAMATAQSSATHGEQPQPAELPAAQPTPAAQDPANAPPFRGQVVVQPPESERVFGFNPVNKALERYGLALYDISQDVTFTYNLLSPPVPLADQTYNGQRPTFSSSHYPALTYDMRHLHIRGAQLLIQGSIQRNSWYPGGPEATGFGQISYYQSLFKGRVEMKGGYIDNDGEFVGLFVGGLASNGSLGVYAVLPFEAGMSYLPMTAPALNTTFHLPDHLYSKLGFQRSFDPKGGAEEVGRDSVGLRFHPRGDGLLTIYEGGFKRDPGPGTMQTWARVGYMFNTTHYASARPGPVPGVPPTTGNNQAVYLLADRQLHQTDAASPGRGVFVGLSAEYAPPAQNAYTQYYEARIYENGPFARRPKDFVSLVGSHTDYSEFTTRADVELGESVWNSATSVTASYTARLARGTYLSSGLSYTEGPAITPRSHNSLEIIGQLNTFF